MPLSLTVHDPAAGQSKAKAKKVELPAEVFDAKTNIPLIHQVVVAQLAAARQGTHKTKTRAEVRGGGAKPYRQKGTGRARQGSTRAPQFTGGGVVHGPVPRKYDQRTPKKMKAAALRGALSDRARNDRVHVVTAFVPADQDGKWAADGVRRPRRDQQCPARAGRRRAQRRDHLEGAAQRRGGARARARPAEHLRRPHQRRRRVHPGRTRAVPRRPGEGQAVARSLAESTESEGEPLVPSMVESADTDAVVAGESADDGADDSAEGEES